MLRQTVYMFVHELNIGKCC